jgi:mannobiose 2-epimerase
MNYITHLENDILAKWIEHGQDKKNGGFHGYMDANWKPQLDAPKGLLQHARILWSFAAAYRKTANPVYKTIAQQTRAYLKEKFFDRTNQGWYWSVDAKGVPLDKRKHVFSHAYVIYAYSEFALAFSDETALQTALSTFFAMDRHAFDKKNGGYIESFSETWDEIDQHPDLGIKGRKKTMNSHLHMLEALTSLYRAERKLQGSPEENLEQRLNQILDICTKRVFNPDRSSLDMFFEHDWRRLPSPTSFGHDIEASWLIDDAALELGREKETRSISEKLARNTLTSVVRGAGMYTEGDSAGNPANKSRFWWALAEGLVGYLNAYLVFKNETYFEAYKTIEDWIFTHQFDTRLGDWHEEIDEHDQIKGPKCHLWREPSHQTRACLEVDRRWQTKILPLKPKNE